MIAFTKNQSSIPISSTLKVIGIFGASFGLAGTVAATLTYLAGHSDFSMLNTYLSDIGDAAGLPQIIFNSTTLVAAPIRYLILVLVLLSLSHLGAGNKFIKTILILGTMSTVGTILMTAIPFSVNIKIHFAGIFLYFFCGVIWLILLGIKEWQLGVPRLLPVLSFLMVVTFLTFFILVMLFEANVVGRTAAPIWQWIGFFISLIWVYAHSIILSNTGERQQLHKPQRTHDRKVVIRSNTLRNYRVGMQ